MLSHLESSFCGKHKMWLPRGRACPECVAPAILRQAVATILHWKDYVPRERYLEFIKTEAIYCRDEENEFRNCDKDDVNKLEELRTLVLEKRAEFLILFRETMDSEYNKGEE